MLQQIQTSIPCLIKRNYFSLNNALLCYYLNLEVPSCFLNELCFCNVKNRGKKIKLIKIRKTQKYCFCSKYLLRHGVVRVFVSFSVLVFCHGALKLDISKCLQHSLFEHLFNLYYSTFEIFN